MKVTTIAIDLAKNVFQVLGMNAETKKVYNKRLNRAELKELLCNTPACIVVMEACYSSHYWGRTAQQFGHTVKLIPAQHVTPFVRGNKNDSNDALAIFEASSRPNIRFVPIKSESQQEILMMHRIRDRLIKQRIACTNQARGLLVDFGIVFQQGFSAFERNIWDIINDSEQRPLLRYQVNQIYDEYLQVTKQIKELNNLIKQQVEQTETGRILLSMPGIGHVIASNAEASIDKGQAFNSPKELAVWLGLTPRQYASGSKSKLYGITKRGDSYLRKQLIHGARTVVCHADKKDDALNQWITQLKARIGFNKATVATAHKLARLMWVLLRKQTPYQAQVGKSVEMTECTK